MRVVRTSCCMRTLLRAAKRCFRASYSQSRVKWGVEDYSSASVWEVRYCDTSHTCIATDDSGTMEPVYRIWLRFPVGTDIFLFSTAFGRLPAPTHLSSRLWRDTCPGIKVAEPWILFLSFIRCLSLRKSGYMFSRQDQGMAYSGTDCQSFTFSYYALTIRQVHGQGSCLSSNQTWAVAFRLRLIYPWKKFTNMNWVGYGGREGCVK
jgi:hypothetical protein